MRKAGSKSTANGNRHLGNSDAASVQNVATAQTILDAVVDQNGGRWIKYGSPNAADWFSAADIVARPAAVFNRLAKAGVILATSRSQHLVKEAVETHTDYRSGLVADRPGWTAACFVMGDGTVVRAPGDNAEVIVAFETDSKFTAVDTLAAWQAAVEPFLPGQPLVRFALALSLVGPLLRFAPKDFDNPIVEYVGPPERGKSTVMSLAASVWAGDPGSKTGGADSWSMTINAPDQLRLMRADNLLALDEGGEMPGDTPRERQDVAEKLIFKFSSTGHKRRMGDPAVSPHTRGVLLSNTNLPLTERVAHAARHTRDALLSRMITVRIGEERPFGVFSVVPDGFASSEAASRALRQAVEIGYGCAGRAFAARLVAAVSADPHAFERMLAEKLAAEEAKLDDLALSSRIRKTLAMVAVAGLLGQRFGVLPIAWGSIRQAVRVVARRPADDDRVTPQPPPRDRIQKYLDEHKLEIVNVAELTRPLDRAAFERTAGFRHIDRHGRESIYIPTQRLQSFAPDYQAVMRSLRTAGLARGEPGEQSKLSIKAPRSICATGRVYCLLL